MYTNRFTVKNLVNREYSDFVVKLVFIFIIISINLMHNILGIIQFNGGHQIVHHSLVIYLQQIFY